MQQQRARTKIVATVGPACRDEKALQSLVEAGVDVFRLNMAHGDLADHEEVLGRIRRVSDALNQPVGVLVDLGGPKIRLGELPGGQIDCQHGAELTFVRGDEVTKAGELVTNYPGLIDELHVNDRVMLVDGTVRLDVFERGSGLGALPRFAAGLDPQPAGSESARREDWLAGYERCRPQTCGVGRRQWH